MAFPPGEMIAIAIIFSIMPLIVVSLRLWARRIINAKYAMDDYFVFFGLAFCIASGITITIGSVFPCTLSPSHRPGGPTTRLTTHRRNLRSGRPTPNPRPHWCPSHHSPPRHRQQSQIRHPNPHPPLLRQREAECPIPLPPDLNHGNLQPYYKHPPCRRRRLDALFLLRHHLPVWSGQRIMDAARNGAATLLCRHQAGFLREHDQRFVAQCAHPRVTDPYHIQYLITPSKAEISHWRHVRARNFGLCFKRCALGSVRAVRSRSPSTHHQSDVLRVPLRVLVADRSLSRGRRRVFACSATHLRPTQTRLFGYIGQTISTDRVSENDSSLPRLELLKPPRSRHPGSLP